MDTSFQTEDQIDQEQAAALQQQLRYITAHSPYYKRVFNEQGIDITAIQSIADLQKLPFTSKEDLNRNYQEMLCIESGQIADTVVTSGTLGEPIPFHLSEKDLERLALNEYLSLSIAGVTAADKVQLSATMDKLFMAGLAYYMGLRKIGAGIIRVGPGAPELQWNTIKRFAPTVFIGVPSFIIKLLDYAEAHNINPAETSVKRIICIGEAIRNEDFTYNNLGKGIVSRWPVLLHSTYASTEMSTAFTECTAGQGGHQLTDLIITEFVDEHDAPVAEGEVGELVITTLGVESMPLVRFKTGDLCRFYTSRCACGRHTKRVGPIVGRKKQMIKFKGTTLYPPALSEILNEISCIRSYYTEVYHNDLGLDVIRVHVACRTEHEENDKIIKDHFKAKIRVTPEVLYESFEQIEKTRNSLNFRKPVDFLDNRK
ncbi:phenylacetate--CoA ligase family protein [Cytophaga hutchinsonii]|jgi:phenylacetate-CoA ligase|uniref:Phenylacetate-CoA ligase n=1 Tax=Cytophaga hutchinsonii (strain ATCC 33406 / DSM 1761 / CIP 103989 / NBRC 15051 / NCIMB 9469 / D465) TaxID=269798 RepID=A0A6N4SSI8_CYTH3|nr:AMP-binding protein [Cytophaga hutchinsonii]ABG59388.1 phenylacetate-CoA ligase [Cytophaga hutchinsonii ATCC 33406]SFX92807.1 phenylacetate-CoA ligase [Cytophaga hutchinsonii ATCC 33406]